MTNEQLLTPTEVATQLRKSRSWVYAASARGELPCTRVGRDLRFSPSALARWLESHTVQVTPAGLKGED